MNKLIFGILNFMINNNAISKEKEELEFYRYGIEITLSSLINIVLISIIGIVTNYTFESMMFLTVFIVMRSFTGGYHANTYIKCNLVTSISFVILLLLFKVIKHISLRSIILIAIFQVVTIVLLSPIENKNKPIENRTVYKTSTAYSNGTVTNLSNTKTSYSVKSSLYSKTSGGAISSTSSNWKTASLSKNELVKATASSGKNASYTYSARTQVMRENSPLTTIQSDYA